MQQNRISKLIENRNRLEIVNLTESNPTQVGFDYNIDFITSSLTRPESIFYEPDPKGLLEARESVCNYYKARKVKVELDNIFLTASTSEAYTFLFKLLADPGEQVLVPIPSYPLFEHLAQAETIKAVPYNLYYDGDWHIDIYSIKKAINSSVKAIIIVSPNNPTGSCLKKDELDQIIEICLEHQIALISDEVFSDYTYQESEQRVKTIAEVDQILSFTMSGLSKVAGLPQIKLGWVVVNGPSNIATEAMLRLEFIADLFLSVSTPVQHAARSLFESVSHIQTQIKERVLSNRTWLQSQLGKESVCSLLSAEAGWYSIIQVPNVMTEEEMILQILEQENVLIHPGYFFDFASEGWLITSLIVEQEKFKEAMGRILSRAELWLK